MGGDLDGNADDGPPKFQVGDGRQYFENYCYWISCRVHEMIKKFVKSFEW